ncbi:MAG: TIGR04255 family protein [Phycisphaeraceae bacterium]
MAKDTINFDKPPVVEVAISVQFDPIEGLTTAHLGLLWQEYRKEFPKCVDQPSLEPVKETFGQFPRTGPKFTILTNVGSKVRLWFMSENQSDLIQIQHNRFVRNWRQTSDSDMYPRYPQLRESFSQEYHVFLGFLEKQGLPLPRANQCEVTYVNHIQTCDVWERHGQLDRVLNLWKKPELTDIGPEPENARVIARYVLNNAEGKPVGRLHIDCEPAFHATSRQPIFVLKLVARGEPDKDDFDGMMDFFDRGRQYINRAFMSITTDELHHVWGRTK